MGKKGKVGKQRKDKFYHLAKETGYRSRAAFKLLQLNRKYEFLQRSGVLVDLCAAPGGWLQVAAQNTPMSAVLLGVDLAPIRPLANVIALQGDITEEKTVAAVRRELKGLLADCVLHDGAPNVGQNWLHDAFTQARLTLSALKLATSVMKKGAWFVTKVFRSKDYPSLLPVFAALFTKVHVTKPAASRNESAEIFVACQGYKRPDKVDPLLLDAKAVFHDVDDEHDKPKLNLHSDHKKQKKAKALGYAEGQTLLFRRIAATDFVNSDDCVALLAEANQVELDDERIASHAATTGEIKQCLNDIKVLGRAALRSVLQWRKTIKKYLLELHKAEQPADADNDAEEACGPSTPTVENCERSDEQRIDAELAEAQREQKRLDNRKKKKELRAKRKERHAVQLNMVIPGDRPDTGREADLFHLAMIKSKADMKAAAESDTAEVLDDEEQHSEPESEAGGDAGATAASDDDGDGDGGNPLLLSAAAAAGQTRDERMQLQAQQWFAKETFAGIESDEDDIVSDNEADAAASSAAGAEDGQAPAAADATVSKKRKRQVAKEDAVAGSSGKRLKAPAASDVVSDSDMEADPDASDAPRPTTEVDAGGELQIVPSEEKGRRRKLDAETLAIGEMLVHSSATRRKVIESAYNRYMHNDENLPDWFAEDEKKHWRPVLPVDKATVADYKARERELNDRPIKKVAEAKMRKKKKAQARMSRAKKKAEGIVDNPDLSTGEKARQMQTVYKKALRGRKPDVKYVKMTKGRRGAGAKPKGPYKMVDTRLKKDNRKKGADAKKGSSRGRPGRTPGNKSKGAAAAGKRKKTR